MQFNEMVYNYWFYSDVSLCDTITTMKGAPLSVIFCLFVYYCSKTLNTRPLLMF